jgi:hypothetical protein
MCLVEVLLLEHLGVRFEHRGAQVAAHEVADLTTEHGGHRDEHQQLPQLEVGVHRGTLRGGTRGQHARHEQQRVTGQDREQHTGFDEDDDQDAHQGPGAELLDQLERVEEIRHQGQMGGGHEAPRYRAI